MAFRPVPYDLDPTLVDVRAGEGDSFAMALRAGRLVATVVSARSGKHVTVQLRAKRRGGRRFAACELAAAERVYLDTPNPERASKEIGCLHLVGKWEGKILPPWESELDESRVWAARRVLDIAQGRAPVVDGQASILEGRFCLLCGQELTDPESIKRNIGPKCWANASGLAAGHGEHQKPNEQIGFDVEELAVGKTPNELTKAIFEKEQAASREEIEAEIQQTVKTPEDGDGNGDLEEEPEDDRDLFSLPAGADPREVLAQLGEGQAC